MVTTGAPGGVSGTIASVFPSKPTDGDRDPWDVDNTRQVAKLAPSRSSSVFYAGAPDGQPGPITRRPQSREEVEESEQEEVEFVPVRRSLSLAIAGFAGLLG